MTHRKNRLPFINLFTLLMAVGFSAYTNALSAPVSSNELVEQLDRIDSQLETLAHLSLRSGIGTIGYRSTIYTNAYHNPWIKIDFGQAHSLDEIILIPALWLLRDTQKGYLDDGFPVAFKIYGGSDSDLEGKVIASYTQKENAPPNIAPVIIPLTDVVVSWIRLEATQLTARHFDGLYGLQFSEILVFSGYKNIALHKAVTTTPAKPTDHIDEAWKAENIVDGFMPYLMDAAEGEQSIAYLSPIGIGDTPTITIDLHKQTTISSIHLHTLEQGDTIPQGSPAGVGLPFHYRVEGASKADFSDAQNLIEAKPKPPYDMGPILMWNFPETSCRFVRLTAIAPDMFKGTHKSGSRIGFAEINILSQGKSVSTRKSVSTNFDYNDDKRSLDALTDGRNLYGNILPIRIWLKQLATRHQLETQRPHLAEALNSNYLKQKQKLQFMGWIIAALALISTAMFFIDRLIRQRAIIRTRERIAADLHDELGANLHAIGLLSDLAQTAKNAPDKLDKQLQRIRALTERTGKAARYCSNMLEAKGLYDNLTEDMRRAASRMMPDREHEITFEGEQFLNQLKGHKQIDLFLFYKESLANILRHSDATHVDTHLIATAKNICLTISERGNTQTSQTQELAPPPSLVRRAKMLGGTLSVHHPLGEGPQIQLIVNQHKFRFPR